MKYWLVLIAGREDVESPIARHHTLNNETVMKRANKVTKKKNATKKNERNERDERMESTTLNWLSVQLKRQEFSWTMQHELNGRFFLLLLLFKSSNYINRFNN